MPDANDPAARSAESHTDQLTEQFLARALLQLMIAINGLLLVLLLGTCAVAYAVTVERHYETMGAFIDFLRLIAQLWVALVLVVFLAMTFRARRRNGC
jgi:hypothetical protein